MGPRIILTRGRLPATAYAERFRDAGAEPIEIGAGQPIPSEFDGLCLSGGPDVEPARYGQERAGAEDPDLPRDDLELDRLLPLAMERGVPILAICRGLQVLNVHKRGSLFQNIGEEHRAKHDDVKPHSVRIEPTSLLAKACGSSLVVNSRHHQAIDRLGIGLRPTAWAGDLIEGVELTGDRWIVGVQWHPERVQDALDPAAIRIFGAFVREAERVPAK